ncbi:MAG: hypothetical protein RL563_1743 [Pseudomonadota bacterium]|jgi:molybdopterin molybdotransferase
MPNYCDAASAGLLSVDQAKQAIASAICPIVDCESIALSQALARVLSEGVFSPIDIPPHRNAAMDGYAFASSDLKSDCETSLNVVGCSWAGRPFSGEAKQGECVRIFTGAVVPDFADSVIAQEQVERQADLIMLQASAPRLKNIRAAGSDVMCNDKLLDAGKILTAIDLGLLASAGVASVKVRRRLRIGFFSTGDELISLSQSLGPGQIYDSNRYLLSGLLTHPNHEVTDLGIIKDDADCLQQTLIKASQQFDVLISSGGASVGDADFVKQALESCGEVNFWKIAIKPGKPLAFGRVGSCWYFGLPGNPVAVSVTYQQFVQPALHCLSGAKREQSLRLRACCEQALSKAPGRQEYQRGLLRQNPDGELIVSLAGSQDSHQQKSASRANCYIVLGADCVAVAVGEYVNVEPFSILI